MIQTDQGSWPTDHTDYTESKPIRTAKVAKRREGVEARDTPQTHETGGEIQPDQGQAAPRQVGRKKAEICGGVGEDLTRAHRRTHVCIGTPDFLRLVAAIRIVDSRFSDFPHFRFSTLPVSTFPRFRFPPFRLSAFSRHARVRGNR